MYEDEDLEQFALVVEVEPGTTEEEIRSIMDDIMERVSRGEVSYDPETGEVYIKDGSVDVDVPMEFADKLRSLI